MSDVAMVGRASYVATEDIKGPFLSFAAFLDAYPELGALWWVLQAAGPVLGETGLEVDKTSIRDIKAMMAAKKSEIVARLCDVPISQVPF